MHFSNLLKMSSDLVDYNSLVLDLLTANPPAIAFDVTYRVLDSEVLIPELDAFCMILFPLSSL